MPEASNISQIAKHEDILLRLESNDDFKKLVVLPYQSHAAGALARAKAEARKPASERNLQAICDALREHTIYQEVATLVSLPLADLRRARADKEKTAAQKEGIPTNQGLSEEPEPA